MIENIWKDDIDDEKVLAISVTFVSEIRQIYHSEYRILALKILQIWYYRT